MLNDIEKWKWTLGEWEFDSICPVGFRAGVLYGLPKVQKAVSNNIPKFQPILSAIDTPLYNLAKCLVPILTPLILIDYTLDKSFSFAEKSSVFIINF